MNRSGALLPWPVTSKWAHGRFLSLLLAAKNGLKFLFSEFCGFTQSNETRLFLFLGLPPNNGFVCPKLKSGGCSSLEIYSFSKLFSEFIWKLLGQFCVEG